MERRAKIVATLGPATTDERMLGRLLAAGADVLRFNLSHGTQESHRRALRLVRKVAKARGLQIPVLLDLMGPRYRLGELAAGPRLLRQGEHVTLGEPSPRVDLPVDDPDFLHHLRIGERVLIDNGLVELEITAKRGRAVAARVIHGGSVSTRKGINLPDSKLPFTISDKDASDIAFAVAERADFIAASYVGRARDLEAIRAIVGRHGAPIPLVAKLERAAAIEHIEEIVAAADAVMVARGDLGVEVPLHQVPVLQKRIIAAGRRLGKPVIVATQMLESMIESPVPTRAEASDVATAIYDGADAVMLSAESAAGKYPVEAVTMMNRIIEGTEADGQYRQLIEASHAAADASAQDVTQAVCCAMRRAAALIQARAIVCFTSSGHTALRAARERTSAPILGVSPRMGVARKLALAWGVHSVHLTQALNLEQIGPVGAGVARGQGFAEPGTPVVVLAGMPFGESGTTNLMHVALA